VAGDQIADCEPVLDHSDALVERLAAALLGCH
jgi:hypothetical protein